MKLGLRAHDFGRQRADTLASAIAGAGFACCQMAPAKAIEGINHFNDITDHHLEDIQEAFAHHNVDITVLGCYIEPSYTDSVQRLEQVQIFKNNIVNAKKIGCNLVGTETTRLDLNTPEGEREKIYQLLKDSVLRMVEQGEKEGVYVGIEPVAEHTLNTPALARRLLDEVNSKYLKIIFDPVNLILPSTISNQQQIFAEMTNLLGAHVAAMHIKDVVMEDGKKVWRNIGTGAVNYSHIATWLKANHPNMHLLREEVKPDSYETCIQGMTKIFL